jgi:hypothetical protein
MSAHLNHATRETSYGVSGVAASVSRLLACRFPAAVSRLVITVVVDSPQAEPRLGFAHVREKILEKDPSVANSNAASSIPMEILKLRVTAAGPHVGPNSVNPSAGSSVCKVGFDASCDAKATRECFSRHNDGQFIVVFSGERPATTGAHCDLTRSQ